jgi:CubicO group peptidase (beta-lactamase class C family)
MDQGYGYADVASGRELTVNTPMSVQSITKSVTAWGVMRLVEKGLIDLDAPVSQYLKSWRFPQSDYPTENITTRQLLSHTAGMPLGDFTNVYSPGETMPSNRDVMTREAVLTREAGTGFSYSNTGYNLIGNFNRGCHGAKLFGIYKHGNFSPAGHGKRYL